MAKKEATNQQMYALPQALDLLAAQNLKEKLLELFNQDGDLVIDGSNVERITTPCIEVLVAVNTAYSQVERAFQIDNPSEYLTEAFVTLGLGDDFEQWRTSQ